ncbi:hypothetical protein Forpi1262_v003882 [Fusarium oxysporum f. sp. raphani]|uniref:Uncharacterized protein n=1 Tax=Fusarium oxysporum f. sp. raphani TaxID=96318 RepID=A0A8J5UPD5_FUSOX|nr:hypothetical protein Forpi1262_v003882 [Fusarium oxysporum f. sp. raphani]
MVEESGGEFVKRDTKKRKENGLCLCLVPQCPERMHQVDVNGAQSRIRTENRKEWKQCCHQADVDTEYLHWESFDT